MITLAELAKGRALRDAERDEKWQTRTTYAVSDWLDRHCDDLIEAAEALAEKDAQIAALQAKIDDAEGPWWVSELANEGYEAKREVERQQAAMQQFSEWLTVRDNMWMERAHNNRHGEGDVCDEHHVELVDVREEFDDVLARLRKPAPPLTNQGEPMPKPDPIIDVQTTLDDWLASNPEAQKYVRKIYYVPDGAEIPRDVTHMNRLTSIDYPDLELRLGVVATIETAALSNLILGILERTADDPKA